MNPVLRRMVSQMPGRTTPYSTQVNEAELKAQRAMERWNRWNKRTDAFIRPQVQRWINLGLALLEIAFIPNSDPLWVPLVLASFFLVRAMWEQTKVNDERIARIAERLLRGGPHDRH